MSYEVTNAKPLFAPQWLNDKPHPKKDSKEKIEKFERDGKNLEKRERTLWKGLKLR